jgi:hypothetical protein
MTGPIWEAQCLVSFFCAHFAANQSHTAQRKGSLKGPALQSESVYFAPTG